MNKLQPKLIPLYLAGIIGFIYAFFIFRGFGEILTRDLLPNGNGWNFLHQMILATLNIFSWLLIGAPGLLIYSWGVHIRFKKYFSLIGNVLMAIGVMIMAVAGGLLLAMVFSFIGWLSPFSASY